jgi:hypothetical protein
MAAIKKQEAGIGIKHICRQLGISEATFYNLESKVWRERVFYYPKQNPSFLKYFGIYPKYSKKIFDELVASIENH